MTCLRTEAGGGRGQPVSRPQESRFSKPGLGWGTCIFNEQVTRGQQETALVTDEPPHWMLQVLDIKQPQSGGTNVKVRSGVTKRGHRDMWVRLGPGPPPAVPDLTYVDRFLKTRLRGQGKPTALWTRCLCVPAWGRSGTVMGAALVVSVRTTSGEETKWPNAFWNGHGLVISCLRIASETTTCTIAGS